MQRTLLSVAAVAVFAVLAAGSGDDPKSPHEVQTVDPRVKVLSDSAAAVAFRNHPKESLSDLPQVQRDSLINLVLFHGNDATPGMAEWKAEGRRILREERRDRENARQRILAQLKAEHDDFQHVTWYRDRTYSDDPTTQAFQAYIGKDDNGGQPYLRLLIRYFGTDWIFFDTAEVLADGKHFSILQGAHSAVKEDNDERGVWEWADLEANDGELQMLRAITTADDVRLRLSGKYSQDRAITAREKAAIGRVLAAYTALGGPDHVTVRPSL